MDFPRDASVLRKDGAEIPLWVNLTLGDFGTDASRKLRGPVVPASYFEWGFINKRRNSSIEDFTYPARKTDCASLNPARVFGL